MGKFLVLFAISVVSAGIYIDARRGMDIRERQMRTVYATSSDGITFDVRFSTKTPVDLTTLDGVPISLSESCGVIVKRVDPKQ